MDTQMPYNDAEVFDSHLSNSHHLEIAYHQALHGTESILQTEDLRRSKLQILLLEHDNYDLHQQLVLEEDRAERLEQEAELLKGQLSSMQEDARQCDADLRARLRELHTLKAELDSMNGANIDATKVLTEKLSLAREVAIMKPELEHLRSQAAHQHAILTEKLTLERQVSTLEVELENEKRASRRAAQINNHNGEKELEQQQQLEELQKELARVQRDKEKIRKEAEKDSEVWETRKNVLEGKVEQLKRATQKGSIPEKGAQSQENLNCLQAKLDQAHQANIEMKRSTEKEVKEAKEAWNQHAILESKLDQMRTKLKAAKEELRHSKAELEPIHVSGSKPTATQLRNDAKWKNTRKRAAPDIDDGVIGTPDVVAVRGKRPATKRAKVDQSMVGEKSMFSITPYLNRATSVLPESPASALEQPDGPVEVELANLDTEDPAGPVDRSPRSAVPSSKIVSGRRLAQNKAKQILGQASSNISNCRTILGKSTALNKLERVAEEEVDENVQANAGKAAAPKTLVVSDIKQMQHIPDRLPLKKKRKLLSGGKTLFDEEDGEVARRPAKVTLAPSSLSAKGVVARQKISLQKGLDGTNGFGGFSPLKKDRRGISASFLA